MKATKQPFKKIALKQKSFKTLWLLLGVIVLLVAFNLFRDTAKVIDAQHATALLKAGKVEKLSLQQNYLYMVTAHNHYKIYKEAIDMAPLYRTYPIEVKEESLSWYDTLSFLLLIGLFGYLFYFLRQSQQKQFQQLERSSANGTPPSLASLEPIVSDVTFKDVAGIKDVKEELEEIIDFLREPQKYRALDIRLPKGVLLVGPPGVGKTLISKAVAGEAGVPFFYQSGASFVHIYVGMGAKRVSELFQKAKQMAPSIVFIDEIDAVGKSRGEFRNDEREATLNQLLTEMDGFEESSGVIVIGATNKIEVMDEALLRAGRFDRRIHIALPDLEERCKTLALYLAHKPHSVDVEAIGRMTVGFSSAALDTLTNEAALYAMRAGRSSIENSDFEAVKEKVLLGKQKVLSFTQKEREIQACYQGAKALVATWLDVPFEKIGIVTTQLSHQEYEIVSRSTLLNRIKVYLAGSLATQHTYQEQFTNGSDDIAKAKEILYHLVHTYGMNENFIVTQNAQDQLLLTLTQELNELLLQLDTPLSKVKSYLLEEENITKQEVERMVKESF